MGHQLNCGGFREILRQELSSRRERNPGYSQRAFARDLGIRSNRLSEVLRGKQGLSLKSASLIAERLEYPEDKKRLFCSLVQLENKRASKSEIEAAKKEIRIHEQSQEYHQIGIDTFKVISDWYHLAILELIKLSDFVRDPVWIARKLSISKDEAIEAVLRLKRVGMLEEREGTWVLPKRNNNLMGGISAESIKKFHEQFLKKAIYSLHHDSLETREFRTTFISIKKESTAEAKRRVDEFWKTLDRDLGEDSGADSVYGLGIQFFNITNGGEK